MTALVLAWCGTWQGPVIQSRTHSTGDMTVTSAIYEMQWPLWVPIALLAVAGLGVILLLIPPREKTNA